jgi:hypothetical protein
LAVHFGSNFSESEALTFLFEYVKGNKNNIFQRARQRGRYIEVTQNVTFKPPKVIDAFDSRAALDDTAFHAVLDSWGMAYRAG